MFFFDFIYLFLVFPIALVRVVFIPQKRRSFWRKFTRDYLKIQLKQNKDNRRLWVHAASMGEVKLALRLIKKWSQEQQELRFILTTNTLAGLETSRKNSTLSSCISPLDFSWSVKAFIKHTGVTDLILIETEIWPNMIKQISKRGKVIVVNGRLSDRHIKFYHSFKWFLKGTFSRIDLVLAGDQKSAKRFQDFGVKSEKIEFCGNLKFELYATPTSEQQDKIKAKYQLDNKFIIVAGSIQPEELPEILKGWKIILKKIPQARLILVPRHPEKGVKIQEILKTENLSYSLASRDSIIPTGENNRIHVIDQMGVLRSWYALADVIFVGGSLCNRGGQNILEAVALKKPVCTGHQTPNFKQDVDILLAAKGLKIIKNGYELSKFIEWVVTDSPEVQQMAENGFAVIKKYSGALAKNIEHLNQIYQLPHNRSVDDK